MRQREREIRRRKKKLKRKLVVFAYRCILIVAVLLVFVLARNGFKKSEKVNFASADIFGTDEYPESLLAMAERYPETAEFVENYHRNKGTKFEIDLSNEVKKGEIPLFIQWDERWGYESYGNDFFAVTGCGPTCLSMVYCGLSGETDWNPLKVAQMAEEKGYYVEGAGSSWDLMTEGAEHLGLSVWEVMYDKDSILKTLSDGRPIICTMRPGDFTTSGHFIVLKGVDEEGKVIVCDPNSKIKSEMHWEIEDIFSQIKNLWSYTYSS